MEHVIGVLPAGGRARRIHGFFKEMMPIGINEKDKSKFVVSSERILECLLAAGASSVHYLLNPEKTFIAEYYARQELFTGRVNFNYISKEIESRGLPYALDSLYDQLIEFDYVVMGFPDNFIEPVESFKLVLQFCKRTRADLALGLYKTDSRNKGGYIRFDARTNTVLSHVDHSSSNFPTTADNLWAIACWNRTFTEFIHSYLKSRTGLSNPDIPFGVVIDAALSDLSLRVLASFVDERRGFHWDIANPDKYFNLLRQLHSADDSKRSQQRDSPRVFIGHGRSSDWRELKDFIAEDLRLEWVEFNREPSAGISTKERLDTMLDEADFAFLVMAAEDEHSDGRKHARENVIHELGLFQGRLGFRRAIVLLEESCAEFSNIYGLTHIPYPSGNLRAVSEEIRRVLKREGLLQT